MTVRTLKRACARKWRREDARLLLIPEPGKLMPPLFVVRS